MIVEVVNLPKELTAYSVSHDHKRISRHWSSIWGADPRLKGRVLDVGCGEGGPSIKEYHWVWQIPNQVDGVDPFPNVANNPWAERTWCGEFDKVELPAEEYDALICMNVIEHVADPAALLAQAYKVLKPGGVFYAMGPHGRHPFPFCVRVAENLGVKKQVGQAGESKFNDYPAYYRMNTRGSLAHYGSQAGFDRLDVYLLPNTQWAQYWPRKLQFLPATFDFFVGCRFRAFYQSLMFKLTKPGQWTGPTINGPTPERPHPKVPAGV